MRKLLLALTLCLPLTANAAISFIAASHSDSATAQSLTPAEPTGTAEDDDLFAFCVAQVTVAIVWVDPLDWTEIDQGNVTLGAGSYRYYFGRKRRGATAGDALTFLHADTAARITCTVATYRGLDGTDPLDVAYSAVNHLEVGATNNPNMTPEDITTATNGAWVVLFYGSSDNISGAAGGPSGYTTDADNVTGESVDRGIMVSHKEIAVAGLETPGVYTHTDDGAGADPDPFTITAAIKPAAAGSAPAFSVSPTAAPTTNGVTISGTITGTADVTVATVGVSPGDGTPTCTQIQAGQNDGGTAALATGSEVWVDSVSNNYTATGTNPIAVMDYHTCARNGIGDSSVVSLADEDRSPRSGFALITHTSVAVTSVCDLDAYFDPDCATGDVFEYEDDTNESADCNVSFEADGDFVLTPVAPGDCDGKRTFNISYEDVSSATTGLFTAPTVGNFTTDDLICNGNSAPVENADPENAIVVLIEDTAMLARDLASLFLDDDGDTLTVTVTTGTAPTGTTVASNGQWTGTPTTEDENGEALTVTATDECGDSDTYDFTAYVVNTWTVPDCVNDTTSACATSIETIAPWRADDIGLTISGTANSDTVAVDDIISQDPAASAEAEPFDPISVIVSLGPVGDYTYVGGMAFDSSGRLVTEYLGAAESVPAGSSFKQGIAYSADVGARFVCDWPVDNGVQYHGGIAVRNDGCMTISTGAVEIQVGGFGMTQRGEVVVTTDAPTEFFNIYGFVANKLCVTEIVD